MHYIGLIGKFLLPTTNSAFLFIIQEILQLFSLHEYAIAEA
jgi:hypothetical protein